MEASKINRAMNMLRHWLETHDNPDLAVALPSGSSWTPREIVSRLEERIAAGYESKDDILDYILEAAGEEKLPGYA